MASSKIIIFCANYPHCLDIKCEPEDILHYETFFLSILISQSKKKVEVLLLCSVAGQRAPSDTFTRGFGLVM